MQERITQSFYLIGVVAQELQMHPQTLRKYEQAGFLRPRRMGGLRLYSDEDLERLRVIKHFVEGMGLNIAGVEVALNMTAQLLLLRARLGEIKDPSNSDKETLRGVDKMLAEYGLQVVDLDRHEPPKMLQAPQMASFEFQPGQALHFIVVNQ
jgi:MerR family transcriptional regulator/heat shock protein HspR